MKRELFPFQKMAVWDMRKKAAEALGAYNRTGTPQILSLQAPTGSGKTIMMASLIEDILFGSSEVPPGEVGFVEQPEAIFVWLSDSPELNLQSKDKIDLGADRLSFGTTALIEESSFAKGLAKYAQAEKRFARIQLIRKIKDSSGADKFKRLDFCKGEIRDKVLRAQTLEELNNIFDTDGFID